MIWIYWSLLYTCFAYWLKWYFYLFSVAKMFHFTTKYFSMKWKKVSNFYIWIFLSFSVLLFVFVKYSFQCCFLSIHLANEFGICNTNSLSHIICQMHYRLYLPFISAQFCRAFRFRSPHQQPTRCQENKFYRPIKTYCHVGIIWFLFGLLFFYFFLFSSFEYLPAFGWRLCFILHKYFRDVRLDV